MTRGKWVTECDQNRVYQTTETWIMGQNLGDLGEPGWLGKALSLIRGCFPWKWEIGLFFLKWVCALGNFQDGKIVMTESMPFCRNKSCPECANGG